MKIKKIEVKNFRLLKDFSIDIEDDLSLIIGKNNTGKTSFLCILQKFLNEEKNTFSYNDFNIEYQSEIETALKSYDYWEFSISLEITIEYNEKDDLSSFIINNLDPNVNCVIVNLPFPATINSLLFYRFLTH